MRRLRYLLLCLLLVAMLVRPGIGCSFEEDDTPTHIDPDKPYAAFVAGKLGVVSGELRIRHMVVAYNNLSGRGLTPAEQKAAIDVDRFYNMGESYSPDVPPTQSADQDHTGPATATDWYVNLPIDRKPENEHSVPGSDYESFANCLDDAYDHAAETLAARRKQYGRPVAAAADPSAGDTPEIREWIAGQQEVFSNCSDETSGFGPRQQPAPVAKMPQPVAANAPLWLKQDRAYQMAAAQFYALDYDHALAGFRAIAADKASPWAPLARYVVARVLIRRATVLYNFNDGVSPGGGPQSSGMQNNNSRTLARLAEARDDLRAILGDPAMSEYHRAAQHLLDYVMVRLDPGAQVEELARRLATPPSKAAAAVGSLDSGYRQNVIDLTFAYNSLPLYSPGFAVKGKPALKPQAPMLRWINDLYGEIDPGIGTTVNRLFDRDPAAHRSDALAAWRSNRQPQWLAAALAVAEPGGEGVAEMTAAARAVPVSSPAYATMTYHRLRLELAAKSSYGELAALMPEIERTQPRSAINLFAGLESSGAPSLDLFLKAATRITPVSIQAEAGEGFPSDNPGYNNSSIVRTSVTLCGVDINDAETRHLDTDTALIFNQRMPLHVLRDAALSPVLPGNIRFEIAHMAWTRALLLDDAETARALAPYLAQCQPAFKTWLDQYEAAKTSEERHVLGLLAMMRFTSTDPTVDAWRERDFAAYDDFRSNWWCAEGPDGQYTGPGSTAPPPHLFSVLVPLEKQPDPPFLTAGDRVEAAQEIAKLQKIGDASDYFAEQALAWVKAHPNDARDADVLGFAMRVVRNACRSNATKQLNHQLFDMVHRRFPKSEWARKYTTWE